MRIGKLTSELGKLHWGIRMGGNPVYRRFGFYIQIWCMKWKFLPLRGEVVQNKQCKGLYFYWEPFAFFHRTIVTVKTFKNPLAHRIGRRYYTIPIKIHFISNK